MKLPKLKFKINDIIKNATPGSGGAQGRIMAYVWNGVAWYYAIAWFDSSSTVYRWFLCEEIEHFYEIAIRPNQ